MDNTRPASSLLISIMILVSVSCSKKIYPEYRPLKTISHPVESAQTVSMIELPLSIPMEVIEKSLNQVIPDRFTENNKAVDCFDVHLIDIRIQDCRVSGDIDISDLALIPDPTNLVARSNIAADRSRNRRRSHKH